MNGHGPGTGGLGPLSDYTVLEAAVYCNQPIVAGMLLEHPNDVTTTTAKKVLEAVAINKRWESDNAVSIIKMLLRRIPTKDMYTLTSGLDFRHNRVRDTLWDHMRTASLLSTQIPYNADTTVELIDQVNHFGWSGR